jgi:hypothetical protein
MIKPHLSLFLRCLVRASHNNAFRPMNPLQFDMVRSNNLGTSCGIFVLEVGFHKKLNVGLKRADNQGELLTVETFDDLTDQAFLCR